LRKIKVVPHLHEWKEKYEKEAILWRELLGDILEDIHHIGSTAIPGLWAKPVIDILIEVKSLEEVDPLNERFREKGYDPKGENGLLNRRYFQKGGDNRTHHVHIFPHRHEEVFRHIVFRDYLIAHPKEAKRYEELKRKLATEFTDNPALYSEGKTNLIRELDEKAKKWHITR
jgi:GrpB-like predicted nucleotidyltransferase (UPF0157 family)